MYEQMHPFFYFFFYTWIGSCTFAPLLANWTDYQTLWLCFKDETCGYWWSANEYISTHSHKKVRRYFWTNLVQLQIWLKDICNTQYNQLIKSSFCCLRSRSYKVNLPNKESSSPVFYTVIWIVTIVPDLSDLNIFHLRVKPHRASWKQRLVMWVGCGPDWLKHLRSMKKERRRSFHFKNKITSEQQSTKRSFF